MSEIGKEALIPNPMLLPFAPFIGVWETTGSHPLLPGIELRGRAELEWHEGGAFVRMRTEIDDPRIPSATAIIGSDDGSGELTMLYFDERQVSRRYDITVADNVLQWTRMEPSFSQRYRMEMRAGGELLDGVGEMSRDGAPWEPDLALTYRRI